MSERTILEGIRAYVEKHASRAGEARMRSAGKTFDLHCSTCREHWLLERVEQLEKALRHAEWNCAPGSEFCPSCHEPMEAMTYGNGEKHSGGHKRSCRILMALAALHAKEPAHE